MIKKSILPKGIRLTQNNSRMLMNTLVGTYAPLCSVELKGMRLPAFDKNRIIAEHDFMVFDQQCSYDVILGGDFLQKIIMNLHYNDLTTTPMDNLNNPQLVAKEVESYLYQMDLEDEGFDALEEAYARQFRTYRRGAF